MASSGAGARRGTGSHRHIQRRVRRPLRCVPWCHGSRDARYEGPAAYRQHGCAGLSPCACQAAPTAGPPLPPSTICREGNRRSPGVSVSPSEKKSRCSRSEALRSRPRTISPPASTRPASAPPPPLCWYWPAISTSTITFYLTQLYAYALPVKIADCYNQMGQFAKAEEYYPPCGYSYINPDVEAHFAVDSNGAQRRRVGRLIYKLENLARGQRRSIRS